MAFATPGLDNVRYYGFTSGRALGSGDLIFPIYEEHCYLLKIV